MHKGFPKSGHLPALFASFPYCDPSFMARIRPGFTVFALLADVRRRWRASWGALYGAARV